MAERLAEMPIKKGKGSRHPWAEWADGSVWRVTQGSDFPGQLESMRVRLYSKAHDLGKQLEIQVDKAEKSITFRMTDPES